MPGIRPGEIHTPWHEFWRRFRRQPVALGAGVLIILLRLPLIDLALHIVGGSEAVLEQARRFLEIRWLSAPASLANLVLLGWLLGVQYARAPALLEIGRAHV